MHTTLLTEERMRELLLRTEIGREFQREQERLALRASLTQEIADLHAQQEVELPPLDARMHEAEAALLAALESVKAARRNYEAAREQRGLVGVRIDYAIAKIEKTLRATADPNIKAFMEWCCTELDRTISAYVMVSGLNWKETLTIHHNGEEIEARLNGLRGAFKKAEALQFRLLSHEEVEEELAVILATIPVLSRDPTSVPFPNPLLQKLFARSTKRPMSIQTGKQSR
jgi:hypothetical protein